MVSKSAIYQIMRDFYYWSSRNPWSTCKTQRSITSSQLIKEQIAKFWSDNPNPFTSKDVSSNLNKKIGNKVCHKVFSQILIKSLGLSYKKGKSCLVGLSRNKQQLLKSIFTAKIIPNISKYDMLINIDESSFSRLTKLNYSWLKRGQPWKLNNIGFINSTSLITAMTSTGKVFAANTYGSVNTLIFIEYDKV